MEGYDALRTLISEVVAEALSKRPDTAARNVLPKQERERIDYEALAIKACLPFSIRQ